MRKFSESEIRYYTDGTPYIPLAVQQEKLNEEYPHNRIDIQVTPDICHEPNAFVAVATIWEENTNDTAAYRVRATARRTPVEASSEDDVTDVTAYDAAATAALRKALSLMGYKLSYEDSQALKDAYLAKISNVVTPPTPAPVPVEEKKAEDKKEAAPAPVSNTEKAAVNKTPNTQPVAAEAPTTSEPKKAPQPADSQPVPETRIKKKPKPNTSEETKATASAQAVEENGISLEEALAMPCNYKSREETLGELYEADYNLFMWMSNSKIFQKKQPKEYKAIQVILASKGKK